MKRLKALKAKKQREKEERIENEMANKRKLVITFNYQPK